MIYFGTSGFSYNDWVGNFYPVGISQEFSNWLPKIQLNSVGGKTFIFANNHWCGQAVSTICQLWVMPD